MILVIDNYDSFTYNLVDLVRQYVPATVVRNDAWTDPQALLAATRPAGLLISPGPGRPADSGISPGLLQTTALPALGVCLGHQLMAELAGGRICHAARPMHGKTDDIAHAGTGLFAGLPSPMRVMRYHSLIVSPEGLPPHIEVTARNAAGEIMALRHRSRPWVGVQFHPESILSEHGQALIANWLRHIGCLRA